MNCSPPEDGREDAGGSSPTPRCVSAEHHRADAATRSSSGTEDVLIRNFVEHFRETGRNGWSFGSARKIPVSRLPAFPPTTRQLVLFATELTPDGMVPTRPIKPCMEVLALTNIAFMQNHIHNVLRHAKNLGVQIASGICAAICTGTYTSGATDMPGAFSLFCCGPLVIETATSGGKRRTNRQTASSKRKTSKISQSSGLRSSGLSQVGTASAEHGRSDRAPLWHQR